MEAILILAITFIVYFLPSLIAWQRGHESINSITIVNLFLGWTFFGWVISLAWAFKD